MKMTKKSGLVVKKTVKKFGKGAKFKKDISGRKNKKAEEFIKPSLDDLMQKQAQDASESSDLSDNEDYIEPDLSIKTGVNNDDSGSDAESTNEFESHKESLSKLKDLDPEFYQFLEENDKKLLHFNESDASDGENDDDKLHKPTGDLDIASDESDFEPDKDSVQKDDRVITLKLLKLWQKDIYTDKSAKTINCLIKAFHAAMVRVSDESTVCDYKVDGSSVFNAVIQLCVLELGPALRRYLKIPTGSKQPPHKSKHFGKIRVMLRGYFLDLLKLLGGVSSTNILNVLLKHLHYMSPFIVSYSSVTKKILKRTITLWSTAEETVRVVAFMCILRITNNNQISYLDMVLKAMYMAYVKNCKFMSKSTLPEINFMRRSLTEMFTLDVNVSYQHVFLYIRQLAIHLRTAVTVHKKENIQAVYNWQFVNSIHLWANLLTVTCNKPQLQPLIYPLIQVAVGVLKLLPTAQYYPLRFHVAEILIELSRDTNIFIPILPFLLEVLTSFDFNKKHKKVSMKPILFTCILRVSKSQMMENGFKDAIIDNIYTLLLEYLKSQAHSISFPDLALFTILQIKQFIKKCSNHNYTKKLKQLLEKTDQNSKFIENERKKISFSINDFKQIDAWETTMKYKNTPISTFYESWKKIHSMKKRKQMTDNEELGEYNLPMIKKAKKNANKKQEGPVELFPSDSEDDDNEIGFNKNGVEEKGTEAGEDMAAIEEGRSNKKNEIGLNKNGVEEKGTEIKNKTPKKKKNKKNVENENNLKDIVEDFKLSDW